MAQTEETGTGTTGPYASWREYVSRHRLIGGLVAGFIATHLATVSGYWLSGLRLDNLDWPAFNGSLILPKDSATAQFITGSVYHYSTGICLSLVFVFLIQPIIPLPNTTLANLGKGMGWGILLAVFSALWWVPSLFPALDAGFFSSNLGSKLVFSIFFWHLVYGVNLGAIYNPLPDRKS